jgi:flagellar hook assembly protein FlgD
VLFQLRDINGTPLTQNDTSNVRIELNGKPVFFTGNTTVQFTLGTAPVLAEIRWTPQLQESENTIKYFAKDAAANSSDTTSLMVKVASKLELFDVYNIPNPFGTGTTFTFTLAGADDPQNAHIKIYTVAGRLIQDLDFSSKVHIGMNGYQNSSDNLYWNGRDKDGNDIANGVYLYRVVINGNGQQTTATQKLVKMR